MTVRAAGPAVNSQLTARGRSYSTRLVWKPAGWGPSDFNSVLACVQCRTKESKQLTCQETCHCTCIPLIQGKLVSAQLVKQCTFATQCTVINVKTAGNKRDKMKITFFLVPIMGLACIYHLFFFFFIHFASKCKWIPRGQFLLLPYTVHIHISKLVKVCTSLLVINVQTLE